jgi:fibronectin type III domain protein
MVYNGGDKITTNTLDGRAIKTGTLTGDRIAANTISGDNIKARSITGDNIESKTITSDKLVVNELAAISGKLGKVESGEVVASSIHSADNSFNIDKSGNIRGANLTGATISGSRIDADSIYQAGFHMRNVDIIVRDYNHGDTIYLPNGYSWDNCVAIPQGVIDSISPKNAPSWWGRHVFDALPLGRPITYGITLDHVAYAYSDHYDQSDRHYGWKRTPYKVRIILILFQK